MTRKKVYGIVLTFFFLLIYIVMFFLKADKISVEWLFPHYFLGILFACQIKEISKTKTLEKVQRNNLLIIFPLFLIFGNKQIILLLNNNYWLIALTCYVFGALATLLSKTIKKSK